MALSIHCRSAAYLIRRPYSYYFRIKVPPALQHRFNRKELRCSLKTGYVSEAKDKARVIAGQIKRLFLALRKDRSGTMAKLTDKKLNEIVRSIINGHLEWFEEEMTFLDKPMSDEDLEHKASFYGGLGAEKNEQRAKGDYRSVSDLETSPCHGSRIIGWF